MKFLWLSVPAHVFIPAGSEERDVEQTPEGQQDHHSLLIFKNISNALFPDIWSERLKKLWEALCRVTTKWQLMFTNSMVDNSDSAYETFHVGASLLVLNYFDEYAALLSVKLQSYWEVRKWQCQFRMAVVGGYSNACVHGSSQNFRETQWNGEVRLRHRNHAGNLGRKWTSCKFCALIMEACFWVV